MVQNITKNINDNSQQTRGSKVSGICWVFSHRHFLKAMMQYRVLSFARQTAGQFLPQYYYKLCNHLTKARGGTYTERAETVDCQSKINPVIPLQQMCLVRHCPDLGEHRALGSVSRPPWLWWSHVASWASRRISAPYVHSQTGKPKIVIPLQFSLQYPTTVWDYPG